MTTEEALEYWKSELDRLGIGREKGHPEGFVVFLNTLLRDGIEITEGKT